MNPKRDTTKNGKRIKMLETMSEDPNPIFKDEMGTVQYIDDMGYIHVKWDNGRTLSVLPEVDKYEILD
jgi:hypothetical protein